MRGRPQLTYANVTATIALLLALTGGIAYAALGRNTVKAKQIAPEAVASSELRVGAVEQENVDFSAVGSPEVIDRALGAQDQLPIYRVEGSPVTVGTFGSGASVQTARADCGPNGEPVSGGHSSGIRTFVTFSQMSSNGWAVILVNSSDTLTDNGAHAVVFCRPYGQAPQTRRERKPTARERADLREALAEAKADQRRLARSER